MTYRATQEKKKNAAPSRILFYRDGVSEGVSICSAPKAAWY